MSTNQATRRHHHVAQEVAPGAWQPAKPARDNSLWHRWKKERACRRETGHCWHPEGFHDWFCCMCAGETEGMPAQKCVHCLAEQAAAEVAS